MITLLQGIADAVTYLKNDDIFARAAGLVSQEDAEKVQVLRAGLAHCAETKTPPPQSLIDLGTYLFTTYLTPKWS